MLNKCSYKCLNDKCIYTGLQESVRGPKKHAYLFPEGKTKKKGGGSKTRKGPSESATLFKKGTKKKGNDGNMWIIGVDKRGVHRWKPFKNVSVRKGQLKNLKGNKDKIQSYTKTIIINNI